MSYHNSSVSIVMPAYNEEGRIKPTLDRFVNWVGENKNLKIELIIVNDGSTDKTEMIVNSYIEKYEWIKIIEEKHVGMMNAIISGINNANYNLIGTLEADSPVDPEYFIDFIPLMNEYDIVVGSRFLGKKVKGKSVVRRVISWLNSLLFTFLFECPIKDAQISFRLYKKEKIKKILPLLNLRHDGFKSSEIIVKAHGLGFSLKEIPVDYKHDEDSKAVPIGIKTIEVSIAAFFALVELWMLSNSEYKKNIFINRPTRKNLFLNFFSR